MENEGKAKKVFGYFTIVVICFIMGFTLTLQIKSVYKSNNEAGNTEGARADQLQKLLNEEKQKDADLTKQLNDTKKANDDYRDQAVKSGNATKAMNDQLDNAEMLAGLTKVTGPGVTVSMDDSTLPNTSNVSNNMYVIHDIDILQVLNELRDAGAEALSLNGERILATTEVRCAGNTVSVNNTRYATPFQIKAIGDPDKLKSALMMRDGIVDELKQWGIQVAVQTAGSITIDPYSGTPQYKYAKTVSGEAK